MLETVTIDTVTDVKTSATMRRAILLLRKFTVTPDALVPANA